MQRRTKQSVIGFLYLSFFGGIILASYFLFWYQAPTCLDTIQNQDETGVDCGGVCSQYCIADLASSPLVFDEVMLLPYTETSSDGLAKVTNPNGRAALKSATYTFTVYSETGQSLAIQKGEISLLPKEEKTILALGLEAEAKNKIELTVTNEEWVAFTDYQSAPEVLIANQRFELLSGGVGYAAGYGLVRNKSPYDMRTLTVNVVLRDDSGKALAVNKTTLNTLQSGEERDFRLVWPRSFEGAPTQAEMSYDFNSFRTDAFVKQYFPGGQYQTLNPGL